MISFVLMLLLVLVVVTAALVGSFALWAFLLDRVLGIDIWKDLKE